MYTDDVYKEIPISCYIFAADSRIAVIRFEPSTDLDRGDGTPAATDVGFHLSAPEQCRHGSFMTDKIKR